MPVLRYDAYSCLASRSLALCVKLKAPPQISTPSRWSLKRWNLHGCLLPVLDSGRDIDSGDKFWDDGKHIDFSVRVASSVCSWLGVPRGCRYNCAINKCNRARGSYCRGGLWPRLLTAVCDWHRNGYIKLEVWKIACTVQYLKFPFPACTVLSSGMRYISVVDKIKQRWLVSPR